MLFQHNFLGLRWKGEEIRVSGFLASALQQDREGQKIEGSISTTHIVFKIKDFTRFYLVSPLFKSPR